MLSAPPHPQRSADEARKGPGQVLENADSARRLRVGVHPAAWFETKSALFSALQQVFPADFFPIAELQQSTADALLVLHAAGDIPQYPAGQPAFICDLSGAQLASGPLLHGIEFGGSALLDARLRNRTLRDLTALQLRAPLCIGEVLAASGGQPLWTATTQHGALQYCVGCDVPALDGNESLRNHLFRGRFFALLPLYHFLRSVTRELHYSPPPLRANLMFDDPNLHSTRYGYIGYATLAQHALAHNYHATMATVPLDALYVNRRAAEIFRANPAQLSFSLHGNNHTTRELAQPLAPGRIAGLLAQALRRAGLFSRRSGVAVSAVQAAPHDECSLDFLAGMREARYAAFTKCDVTQFAGARTADSKSKGLWPAEMVGGFPVLRRIPLHNALTDPLYRDDIVLSAWLDQPIIIYGHHGDLAPGLGVLEPLIAHVNSLGAVQWQNLGAIAESNFATRRAGTRLYVRPFSRGMRIEIPEGVEELVVEQSLPGNYAQLYIFECNQPVERTNNSNCVPASAERISVPCKGISMLWLMFANPLPAAKEPSFRWGALARRIVTHLRDRLRPWGKR